MSVKYLLVFGMVVLFSMICDGASLKERFFDDSVEDDVDEIYDQRQKGDENIRIRVNGVLLAIPIDTDGPDNNENYGGGGSSQASLSSLYQDYLESLSQLGGSSSSSSNTPSTSNDSPQISDSFLELLEYFPHKKRNSLKEQKEDTQARNKISPSSNFQSSKKQLEDVELEPKEIVKNQQKK